MILPGIGAPVRWLVQKLINNYIALPVHFNGVDAYLTRGAGLTGAADSKLWSGSFWIRATVTGAEQVILWTASAAGGAGGRTKISVTSTGDQVDIFSADTAGTSALNVSSLNINVDSWNHVCFGFDMADTAKRFVYINDVAESPAWTTWTDVALDFTRADWSIGAGPDGALKLCGAIADLWIAPGVYIDFSVTANRRKFIDAFGYPVPLGEVGERPGFGQPLVFHARNPLDIDDSAADWDTNRGSGKGMTLHGTLTDGIYDGPSPGWVGYPNVPYIARPVNFDGTNDYLTRGAGLTGAADSKLFTFSCWVKNGIEDASVDRIFAAAGTNAFRVSKTAGYALNIAAANAATTQILDISSSTNALQIADDWVHVLCSVDLANSSNRHLYINDVSNLNVTTYTNDTIDFTQTNWSVGADTAGGGKWNGDIADLWFKPGLYVDFSVAANRRKFIDASGDPVPLGDFGELPGLGQPLAYHAMFEGEITTDWDTNKGSGGGMTLNGALDYSATSPSPNYVAATAVNLTFVDSDVNSNPQSSYSFTSQSLGAAASDRQIIVCTGGSFTSDRTVTAVTVAGISATQVHTQTTNSGGVFTRAAMWIAPVPTGTTGTVVVTLSGTVDMCGIAVYRMVGGSSTPSMVDDDVTVDTHVLSTTLDIPTDGAGLGYVFWRDDAEVSTFTWTNLTENMDETVELDSAASHSSASSLVSGSAARTATDDTAFSQASVLLLAAFQPPPKLAIEFKESKISTSDLSQYSFSNCAFGAAAGDRYIAVAIGCFRSADTGTSITSVSIGGVSASISVQDTDEAADGSVIAGIAIAAVPTGTTGTVVVDVNGTMTAMSISVYRITGPGTVTTSDQDSDFATPCAFTLNMPAGGVAIGASVTREGTTTTWAGLTEDVDGQDLNVNDVFSSAHVATVAADPALSVSATSGSSTQMIAVAAAWGPV